MASNAMHFLRRSGLLFFVLLCSGTLASAQIAGGITETTNTRLGGNNYIVGTVFTPEGSPIRVRMNIRLTSPTWGDIMASTDDAGRFVFSNVGSGNYMVVIDSEKEFEPVSYPVEIVRERNITPDTYTVTIRLRPKENVRAKKPSVISVSNADVPKRAMEFYDRASKLAEAKDYKAAIQELKLAVAEYPKFINAFNQIGVLHMQLNELEPADEAFKAALKIRPDAYEPMINRSVTLFRMTRFGDAESVLRKILKINAESAVAYYYLGRTLNKTGRLDEAEIAYLNCVKKSPGEFSEAHRLLAAIYLSRGASQLVVEQLETYLRLVPMAPDAANLRQVLEHSKSLASTPQPNRKP
ncbi:MAG TPA: tetratricopeptide repeat protein [Pyrinomonadaceae bacterium]